MLNGKYTCVIIDDEPKAIELLQDTITELYNNITVIGTYTRWKDGLDAMKQNAFDILFLDISMPQKNGIDLLTLVPELKSEIIFVTAHAEHAIEAFGFGATGYVLKPINEIILSKTINKAIERIDYKKVAGAKTNTASVKHKIGVPSRFGTDYVNVEDILYLEAVNRYTNIIKKNEKLLSSYSIGKYKSALENHSFCQVHRSYIVNLNYITRHENSGMIAMTNGAKIPLSKQHRDEFLEVFQKHANKNPDETSEF